MMRAVLVTSLILCIVKGQINQFEQDCNVLQTLEALQSRLNNAEKRLQEQETEFAETRSWQTDAVTRLQEQEAELTDAVTRLQEQEAELTDAVTRLQEQETELTDAVTRLQEQEADLAETKSSLTDAVTRLQDQDTEISNLKNSLTVLSRPSQNKAAFTARLNSTITGLGTQQTIVFDDVITNINDCYSATTGIFTANTNGTFFFFVSIMAHSRDRVQTEMVKNGEQMAFTFSYVPETYGQGANGAIMDLTEGDKVWVRQNYGDKVYGTGWCSFSGIQFQ